MADNDYAKVKSQIITDVKSLYLDTTGIVGYRTAALMLGMSNIEPIRRWNNVFVCTPRYMGLEYDTSTDVCDIPRADYAALDIVLIEGIKCTSELQTVLDMLSRSSERHDTNTSPKDVLAQVLTYYYAKYKGFSKLKLMLNSQQLQVLKLYEDEAIKKYNSGVTWKFGGIDE